MYRESVVSNSKKLAKFILFLAICLGVFSFVDVSLDVVRFDLTIETTKSVTMFMLSIFLYVSIRRPEFFQSKPNRDI